MSEVGDNIISQNANWKFDANVILEFDRHVERSVPFYNQGHQLISKCSDFFLSDNSTCYEIGCSTGTLINLISERNSTKNIAYIGIDNSEHMVKKAQIKCQSNPSIEIVCADVLEYDFKKSDMIVLYYTMQFIKPKFRQILFDKIYSSLNWGGGLFLFEKTRAPDARFQDMMTSLYTEFKLDKGFNSDEIINKSQSLKGILEPFSSKGNLELLSRAGFKDITTIFKYICFEGILAIK